MINEIKNTQMKLKNFDEFKIWRKKKRNRKAKTKNEKWVKNEIVNEMISKQIMNASWTMIHGWIDRNDDKSMIENKMRIKAEKRIQKI